MISKDESACTQVTRRTFLKTTTALTAGVSPLFVPHSVFGAKAPSNRLNVGVIGLGTRGTPDMNLFMQNDDVQVVALCDVNRSSKGYRNESVVMGLEPAVQLARDYYARKKRSGEYKGIDTTTDFREIIDRDDIDVVVIVTPDHWHAEMTVLAAEAGKDIYCQKPLSLTVQDGKDMVSAVRKHQRILQTGSQWRSNARVRFACELVRNGYIGELKTIRATIALNNKQGPGPGWKAMPVPEGFDYPMWLGPAPDDPYHKDRCIYKFRFNLNYSGGQITNFGAHALDIAQMGNGSDLTGPIEVEGLDAEWPPTGSLFNTAITSKFRASYANGVELTCASEPPYFGTRFEGTEGWVEFTGRELKTFPESLATLELKSNDLRLPAPNPARTTADPGDFYADHVRNFLDCVKSRQEPIEPVEIGHRTATICHLGNISLKRKKLLKWDPDNEHFLNDDQANTMLRRERREDWKPA